MRTIAYDNDLARSGKSSKADEDKVCVWYPFQARLEEVAKKDFMAARQVSDSDGNEEDVVNGVDIFAF